MTEEKLQEIKEIIQSSHINFLFGSGVSSPFLPLLGNIESDINTAIENNDLKKQVDGYKTYLEKVMLPNKNVVLKDFSICKNWKWDSAKSEWVDNTSAKADCDHVQQNYKVFFETLTDIILKRKTTILNKQVNIFTTNIDVFLETALENLQINYNDGFLGRLNPIYNLSNFKKSVFQRSLHYDHKSEIPIFNIFKIHGSLTWKYSDDKKDILLSKNLEHIDDKLSSKSDVDFIKGYKEEILVVNPENAKFSETVLNLYYYELLRSYSSELERENSVLFIVGFSMDDLHIREITLRAAKSNPTLKIFVFVSKGKKQEKEQLLKVDLYKNIEVLEPEEGVKYSLNVVTEALFKKIVLNKNEDEE